MELRRKQKSFIMIELCAQSWERKDDDDDDDIYMYQLPWMGK